MAHRSLAFRALGYAAFFSLASSCQRAPDEGEWQGPPEIKQDKNSAPKATSPDRLPPGQLLEGSREVYGFSIPKGMRMRRPTPKSVLLSGRVDFDALGDYVKDRIAVRHAELLEGRLVFPNARIRGQPDGIYEFTLSTGKGKTNLLIEDKTRPPGTHGLSEKQRWERAGLRQSGGLIDPNQME